MVKKFLRVDGKNFGVWDGKNIFRGTVAKGFERVEWQNILKVSWQYLISYKIIFYIYCVQ